MKTQTLNINQFASLKTTKGTYNKILKVTQAIELERAKEFTSVGTMRPYTNQEIDFLVLGDFVSLAIDSPAFCRSSMTELVTKAQDPMFRSRYITA